jgi:hypothetical protein
MALFLFALILPSFAAAQKPPAMPVWPALPGGIVWVSRGHATKAARTSASPTTVGGLYTATLQKPDSTDRAAVEFLITLREDGPIVKYGSRTVIFKDGTLQIDPEGARAPVPTAKIGQPLDLTFVTRFNDVAVYANGIYFTTFGTDAPTKLTYLNKDWQSTLSGLVTFARPLSPGQIERNSKAAMDFVRGFASGPPLATLDLELGVFTPVPEPSRIKPYRNALLAQEYKVLDVVDGGSTSIRTGQTLRVFRFGVWDGKKTTVKDLKTGDHVRLKIEPMKVASAGIQNEYQLDTLDTSYDPYYVEVTNP